MALDNLGRMLCAVTKCMEDYTMVSSYCAFGFDTFTYISRCVRQGGSGYTRLATFSCLGKQIYEALAWGSLDSLEGVNRIATSRLMSHEGLHPGQATSG